MRIYIMTTEEYLEARKSKDWKFNRIVSDDSFLNVNRVHPIKQRQVKKIVEAAKNDEYVNKIIIFSVKTEKNEQYGDRSVIDIGDEGIYYAKSEAAKFFDNAGTTATKIEDAPAKIQVIDNDTDPDDDSAPFDVGTDEDF